jgi:hypothetical protein
MHCSAVNPFFVQPLHGLRYRSNCQHDYSHFFHQSSPVSVTSYLITSEDDNRLGNGAEMGQSWVFTCSLRKPVCFNEPSDRPKQPRFLILRTFTARRGQTALLSDVGKGAEESISWRGLRLATASDEEADWRCERLIKPPATLQLRGGSFTHTRPFGVSIIVQNVITGRAPIPIYPTASTLDMRLTTILYHPWHAQNNPIKW